MNLLFLRRVLLVLVVPLFFASCSSDQEQSVLDLKVKTAETLPITDVMDQLLIEVDNDITVLCNVLKCSPSTYERLRNGETQPTTHAEKELRSLLKNSYIEGTTYIFNRDPNTRWFDKMKNYIDSIRIWAYSLTLFTIGFVLGFLGLITIAGYIDLGAIILIVICRFPIYWVFHWLTSKPEIIDNYKNTMDIVWEIIK